MKNFKVKNQTFQPLRLIINNSTIIIPSRESRVFNNITEQMKQLYKNGFIKIRKM